jgi:hypothetical protein
LGSSLVLVAKVVSRKVLGKEKKSMRESRQALLRAALIRDPKESGVSSHRLEHEGDLMALDSMHTRCHQLVLDVYHLELCM